MIMRLFYITSIILSLMTYVNLSAQERVIKEYQIEVHYKNKVDSIIISNKKRLPNIPIPKVVEGKIFYDGKYYLSDVEDMRIYSAKILNVVYYRNPYTNKIFKVYYYPSWQDNDRKKTLNDWITEPSTNKANVNQVKADEQKTETFNVNQDTVVTSTKQFVYEFDDKGKIGKIKNSGLKLVDNRINNQTSGDFTSEEIDMKSEEYQELSVLSLKQGIYLIEKKYNKNNYIISFKIVKIKIQDQD